MESLGVYPLNIDIKTKMILYQLCLKNQENKLLTGALAELQKLNRTGNYSCSWLKKTEEIICENNLDVKTNLSVTPYGYKLKYETFPENLFPHKGLRKVLKSK